MSPKCSLHVHTQIKFTAKWEREGVWDVQTKLGRAWHQSRAGVSSSCNEKTVAYRTVIHLILWLGLHSTQLEYLNIVIQTKSTFRFYCVFLTCTATDWKSNDKFVIKIQFELVPTELYYYTFRFRAYWKKLILKLTWRPEFYRFWLSGASIQNTKESGRGGREGA